MGGHVKRGMSLADLASPSKVPKTDCVGTASSLREDVEASSLREDVEVSSLREDVEASRPGPRHGVQPKYSTSAETHYVWNYHVSTRLAFSHEVRRGTMTLDGTDVGNGKVVTCVVGDMDSDLHSWAPRGLGMTRGEFNQAPDSEPASTVTPSKVEEEEELH